MIERPDIEELEALARRVLPIIGGDKVISKVITLCQYTLGLEVEVQRLDTGWKGANERVLEVGLQAKEFERRLKEEIAGLLAGADADAFTIGNLNFHIQGLDAKLEQLDAKLEQQRRDALLGPYVGGLDD